MPEIELERSDERPSHSQVDTGHAYHIVVFVTDITTEPSLSHVVSVLLCSQPSRTFVPLGLYRSKTGADPSFSCPVIGFTAAAGGKNEGAGIAVGPALRLPPRKRRFRNSVPDMTK